MSGAKVIPLRPAPPPVEALEFQSDIDALVLTPAPRLLRWWPGLAAGLLGALMLAAALTKIDVVVTATGRLTTDAPPVVLAPLERAVIRELRVRPGETVAAGQPLAVLDATFAAADLAALDAQRRTLVALRDRLEAELAGAPFTAAGAEGAVQALLADQRAAFRAARLAALDAAVAGLEAEAASEAAALEGYARQLEIAGEIETMRERLAAEQVGSRLNLLTASAARLEVEQARRRSAARLEAVAHDLAARRAEREAFLRDWEARTLEEIARVGAELARVEELLAKARRVDALTVLRAPAAGVVLETAARAPGSLVRDGEAVVTISPLDAPLVAEVAVRSADVGWLQAGDPATVKIDAFPWRRFGAASGTLRSVSRESYQRQGGAEAVHRGHVLLDPEGLRGLPDGAQLTPGMTLSVDLKVGARSVLAFFLDPLLRGLNESLREP